MFQPLYFLSDLGVVPVGSGYLFYDKIQLVNLFEESHVKAVKSVKFLSPHVVGDCAVAVFVALQEGP